MLIIRKHLILLIFIFICIACNPRTIVTSEELDKIEINIVTTSELPTGMTYSLKLSNNSKYTIIQNNVYLSFPILTETGSKGNEFKIEAKNNKLEIKPGDEVLLNVFAPIEMYENNTKLDINDPTLEFIAYIEELRIENRFHKIGGIGAFNN